MPAPQTSLGLEMEAKDGQYYILLTQGRHVSHTVGFRRPGESLATDRGELPGSISSTSLARLENFRGGVRGVNGILNWRGTGTRLTVLLTLSIGEGSGVYSVGGGVILCVKGIATDIGPVDTENGEVDAPRFGMARSFEVADVSEGSGDTISSGRLS